MSYPYSKDMVAELREIIAIAKLEYGDNWRSKTSVIQAIQDLNPDLRMADLLEILSYLTKRGEI